MLGNKSTAMINSILLFLGGVGMQEILLIGVFVLIFFGAKKIPEFMKGLGKGINEFKQGISDVKKDIENTPPDTVKTENETKRTI